MGHVVVIALSTVGYTSVTASVSTVDIGITNLTHDRLCALKREQARREGQSE